MKLNMDNLLKFIDSRFEGNITQTAKALDLNASTLSRLIAGKTKPGKKVYEAIIEYCKKHNIDYLDIVKI